MAGLGEAEIDNLVDKIVREKELEHNNRHLLQEAEDLRQEHAALKEQIEALEEKADAKNTIEQYAGMAMQFAPMLGLLLGKDTKLGAALGGLGSATQEPDAGPHQPEEDTKAAVLRIIRESLLQLTDDELGIMFSIITRIEQDKTPIPQIDQFVTKQAAGAANKKTN